MRVVCGGGSGWIGNVGSGAMCVLVIGGCGLFTMCRRWCCVVDL